MHAAGCVLSSACSGVECTNPAQTATGEKKMAMIAEEMTRPCETHPPVCTITQAAGTSRSSMDTFKYAAAVNE